MKQLCVYLALTALTLTLANKPFHSPYEVQHPPTRGPSILRSVKDIPWREGHLL